MDPELDLGDLGLDFEVEVVAATDLAEDIVEMDMYTPFVATTVGFAEDSCQVACQGELDFEEPELAVVVVEGEVYYAG